ncbi:MAG: YceI family protein [Myxococcaceae bacterium]
MRSFVALAALVALPAAASTWEIDPNHTESSFVVKHLMVSNVRGQFGKTTGTIVQDDKDITKSTAEITIDATTVDTRVAKRDTHLKSADFFDVEKFPTITFKSTKITKGEGNTLKAEGDLTIHGVTKPVVLNVEYTPETPAAGMTIRGLTATTKINRKDFGLVWNKSIEAGGVMVGDDVAITVEAELHKKTQPTAAK